MSIIDKAIAELSVAVDAAVAERDALKAVLREIVTSCHANKILGEPISYALIERAEKLLEGAA